MSLSQPSIDSLSIHRAEIALELVTPVFMAGARNILENKKKGIKQDYVAELRTPSLRGEMRYWYRAWRGGGEVGDDIEELQRRESSVFGNPQLGSPITLRMKNSKKGPFGAGGPAASTPMLVHGQSERFPTPAFPNGEFTVTISNHFGHVNPIQEAYQALLLLINLGGIGKRSRRGFGSLRVVDEPLPASAKKLQDGLKEALAFLPQLGQGTSFKSGKLPGYPVLHPEHCKIAVCINVDEFETYQGAMRAFWKELRKTQRWIFGYAPKNDRRGRNEPDHDARLASPVHLHIAKVQTDEGIRYCPVMTAFRTSARLFNGESWGMVEQLLKDVAGANNIIYGQGMSW